MQVLYQDSKQILSCNQYYEATICIKTTNVNTIATCRQQMFQNNYFIKTTSILRQLYQDNRYCEAFIILRQQLYQISWYFEALVMFISKKPCIISKQRYIKKTNPIQRTDISRQYYIQVSISWLVTLINRVQNSHFGNCKQAPDETRTQMIDHSNNKNVLMKLPKQMIKKSSHLQSISFWEQLQKYLERPPRKEAWSLVESNFSCQGWKFSSKICWSLNQVPQ